LSMSVGQKAVPTVSTAIKTLSMNVDEGTESWGAFFARMIPIVSLVESVKNWNQASEDLAQTTEDVNDAVGEGTETFDDNGKAAQRNTAAIKAADQALQDYKKAVDEASQANQDALGFTLDYAKSQQDYAKAHREAAAAISAADDDISLKEAQTAMSELEASWHESTNKMIYDMVQTKLSVDGLSDAEYKAAQDLAVQMGLITQAEADQAKAMMDTANAIFEGIQAQEDVKKEANDTAEEIAKLEADKQNASEDTTQTQIDGAQEAATATTTASAATTQTVITDTQTQANAMTAVTNATLGEVNAQTQLQNSVRQTTSDYLALAAAAASVPATTTAAASVPATTTAAASVPATTTDVTPNLSGSPTDRDETLLMNNGGENFGGVQRTAGTESNTTQRGSGNKSIVVNITNPKSEASEDSIRKTLKKLSYIGVVS